VLVEPELTPTSLGELLRRARNARGLSLAQVEADTRIRRRYLDALEADDLSSLPAPVFTRGLVRAYAGYLGVDLVEAAELLNKEEARSEAYGVFPSVQNVPAAATGSGVPTRALAVALVIGMLGVAVGLMLPRYPELFAPATAVAQVRTPGPELAPVAAVPTPQPTAQPTATSAPTAVPSPSPQPTPTLGAEARSTATAAAAMRGVTVEAKISGRVWAQVESDGQVSYSGILMPGERKVWRAERKLSLYVGDGALVEVIHNGQTLGPLGAKGEVARQEWSATR
jgi:cytoskeleton protein RodZ